VELKSVTLQTDNSQPLPPASKRFEEVIGPCFLINTMKGKEVIENDK
jgi:hypothetical protein